jgi:perosamine synthetase
LARIDEILARRAALAAMYNDRLRGTADLELPRLEVARGRISWFVYVLRLAERFKAAGRDRVAALMTERGIACGRYFAPIHLQRAYAGVPHRAMDLRVTESVAERTLALPFFNRLAPEEVDEVCLALKTLLL